MNKILEITKNVSIINAKTLFVNSVTILEEKFFYVIDTFLLIQDTKKILTFFPDSSIREKKILNTHFHTDHANGNNFLKKQNFTVIGNKNFQITIDSEKNMLKNPSHIKKTILPPDLTFDKEYNVSKNIHFFHTPGHTLDSSCLYLRKEKILISGDTILNSNNGYYALPYFYWGDPFLLLNSLEKISQLDIELILPGHGNPIKKEKIYSDIRYLENLLNLYENKAFEKINQLHPNYFLNDENVKMWNPDIHKLNIKKLEEMSKLHS